MMNVVMLVKNRPRLTHQALYTLTKNTDAEFNVTIVDDGSDQETLQMLTTFARLKNVALLRNETSKGITGQARNLGVYWAERYWGRGDWLYLSDNDAYFTPGWAGKMLAAMDSVSAWRIPMWLLGGQNHPYHKPISEWTNDRSSVKEYYAVAGTSQMMRWDTWDRFGPLDAHAPGVCQSEDTAFCNKIREAGGKVGAIWPYAVYDAGTTKTDGTPSIGSSEKARVEGVLYL